MEVINRFKGLDFVDRVPEELWTEDCNIVQEVVIKATPKKKKYKKGKAKEKREDTPIGIQSSREQQGQIRKSS